MNPGGFCCVCLKKDGIFCKCDDFIEKLRFVVSEIEWSEDVIICDICCKNLTIAHDLKILCYKSRNKRISDAGSSKNVEVKLENVRQGSDALNTNVSTNLRRTSARKSIKKINYDELNFSGVNDHLVPQKSKTTLNETNNEIYLKCENLVEPETSNHNPNDPTCTENKEQREDDNFFDDNYLDHTSETDVEEEFPIIKKKTRKKRQEKENAKQNKDPFTCEHCAKQFSRKEHLLSHIRVVHTFETPYHCDKCEEKFAISGLLLAHKRKEHLKERPFVCTYCGKNFLRSTDLCHHVKIHLNERSYICNPCNKGFNTASSLKSHNLCVHTDSVLWKYSCTYCDRKFPMKSNLIAHLRRHTGEKKFVCHICSKSFYDKVMLQKHFRSHTDERLFNCHLCDKQYKDSCSLNVHLKRKHDFGNANVPVNKKKNFICHICPKGFVTDDKLERHLRLHSGIKPYNCTICDKSFYDTWYLKKHLKIKHNVENVEIPKVDVT